MATAADISDIHSEAGRREFNRLLQMEESTMAAVADMGDNFEHYRNIAIRYTRDLCMKKSTEGVLGAKWFERAYNAVQLYDRLYEKIEPTKDNMVVFIQCCLNLSGKIPLYQGRDGLPLSLSMSMEFTTNDFKRMETNMKEDLEEQVTPFAYLSPLKRVIPLAQHDKFFQNLYKVIWRSQEDMSFTLRFRPSVIAAAAVQVYISKEYTSEIKNFDSTFLNLDLFDPPVLDDIKDCKLKMVDLYDDLPNYAAAAGKPGELGSCGMADIFNKTMDLGLQTAATTSEKVCTCCSIL